jgi:hypothetical protein
VPIVRYAHLNPSNPAFSHHFKVSYVSDVQYWKKPSELFIAIFELYNLVSVIKSDRLQLEGMGDRINMLNEELSANFDDTFMSKRTCDTSEDVYHDRQVIDAFTRAGYTLKSYDEDENDLAPLNQVKQPSTLSVDLS